jgi:Tfp pilus assembly protein PilO
MTNPLDQLNLRPQERRVLVIVAFVIFVVLNVIFVRPLFGQFGDFKKDLEKTRRNLAKYQEEIAKTPSYEKLEKQLKSSGSEVLSEELQLQRVVDNQARVAGVMVNRYTPGVRTSTGRTNQFFEDQGLTIDFNTGNKELVEFLVGLASGNSMIRVQDMNLRPDGTGTKLAGNILFVASYQKKAAVAAKPTTGSTAKPAVAAQTKAAPATNTTQPKPVAATKPSTNSAKAGPTNSTKLPKK